MMIVVLVNAVAKKEKVAELRATAMAITQVSRKETAPCATTS